MWFFLVFFILPGLFCGFAGGGGAVALSAPHTVWSFCAGAAVGFAVTDYGERRRFLSCIAPFSTVLLMIPAGTVAAVCAAGFSAGIIAALPERVTGKIGKFFFVMAAVAAVMTVHFLGTGLFCRFCLGIIAMLLPLPAVLCAGWRGLRGGRMEKSLLSVFMALAVAGLAALQLFFPHLVSWSRIPGKGCFYRIRYQDERDRNTFDIVINGGGAYRFPDAYSRNLPVALPASLEPDRSNLKVLFIGEVPSGVPSMLEAMAWVERVDRCIFAPESCNISGRYDLVLVSELPGQHTAGTRDGFIRFLKSSCLAADGVLVYPANGSDISLPGMPDFAVYQPSGRTVTSDINEIDRRLSKFSPAGAELLPAGMLETLYSLVPEKEMPELKSTAADWRGGVHIGWKGFGVAAGIYFVLRFLLGRYPGVTPCAAALEHGLAAGIIISAGAAFYEKMLLVNGTACGVLPLLLVCAVPGMLRGKRRADVKNVFLYFAAVSAGMYFAPLFAGAMLASLIFMLIIPGLVRL